MKLLLFSTSLDVEFVQALMQGHSTPMEVVSASRAAGHSVEHQAILYRLKYLAMKSPFMAGLNLGYLAIGRQAQMETRWVKLSKSQQSLMKNFDLTTSLLEDLPPDWPDYLQDEEVVFVTPYYGKSKELALSSLNTLYTRRKDAKKAAKNQPIWSCFDYHFHTMITIHSEEKTNSLGAKTKSVVPPARIVVYNRQPA